MNLKLINSQSFIGSLKAGFLPKGKVMSSSIQSL